MILSNSSESKLTRIGVFYDGNYFDRVSSYYLHQHERKARISVTGLHQFIVSEVSKLEDAIDHPCRVVDAHYFRGRLSASEAQSRGLLYKERVFDEILMREGIISHFLPLSGGGEKGIDVWLALESFELSLCKRFDVVVLITGDGDYLPLIRKINTIGVRVMVLGWDFSYTDEHENEKTTKTAQTILDEATYSILMNSIIDDRSRKMDSSVNNLFVQQDMKKAQDHKVISSTSKQQDSSLSEGSIIKVLEGYGFIKPNSGGENLFFHYTSLKDVDFNSLSEGDKVTFSESSNDKGPCAINIDKV